MARIRYYYFPVTFIVLMGLLQLGDTKSLRYSDALWMHHEYWRLLTAHWVHLNWVHWGMNSLGFILLVMLLRINWSVGLWLSVISLLSIGISLGFVIFNPYLKWYVGFSGVLYGLYMLAAIVNVKQNQLVASSILVLVIGKIGLEQFYGEQVTSQSLLNAPVVIDAHAYGLLIGLIMGIIFYFYLHTKTHETA